MPAVGEQHPREREIGVDGRYQPGSAMLECGRSAPRAGRGLVRDDERAGPAATGVREARDLVGRDEERGVLHPQRSKDPFLEEARQRLARRPRDQHSLDVRACPVQPVFARLHDQRKAADLPHPGVAVQRHRRIRRPEDAVLPSATVSTKGPWATRPTTPGANSGSMWRSSRERSCRSPSAVNPAALS
jgi:hypothetical protein